VGRATHVGHPFEVYDLDVRGVVRSGLATDSCTPREVREEVLVEHLQGAGVQLMGGDTIGPKVSDPIFVLREP